VRIILIGGGKIVYFLARQFSSEGYHVTIINRDAQDARELAQRTQATVVLGDGSNPERLDEAGAMRADVVLALTEHDQDNLIACQLAKRLYGVQRTLALVNDPDNEDLFQRLGVGVAFSATRVIASLIEQQTNFDDITRLMPIANGRVNVTDLHLTASAPVVGSTLQDISLSEGSLVACIVRGEEVIVPRGATRLQADDHLILISHPEHEDRDLRLLIGHP
jgi:trk system potassium uptake protein TrkA